MFGRVLLTCWTACWPLWSDRRPCGRGMKSRGTVRPKENTARTRTCLLWSSSPRNRCSQSGRRRTWKTKSTPACDCRCFRSLQVVGRDRIRLNFFLMNFSMRKEDSLPVCTLNIEAKQAEKEPVGGRCPKCRYSLSCIQSGSELKCRSVHSRVESIVLWTFLMIFFSSVINFSRLLSRNEQFSELMTASAHSSFSSSTNWTCWTTVCG